MYHARGTNKPTIEIIVLHTWGVKSLGTCKEIGVKERCKIKFQLRHFHDMLGKLHFYYFHFKMTENENNGIYQSWTLCSVSGRLRPLRKARLLSIITFQMIKKGKTHFLQFDQTFDPHSICSH